MKGFIALLAVLCLVVACSQVEKEEASTENEAEAVQQDSAVVDTAASEEAEAGTEEVEK